MMRGTQRTPSSTTSPHRATATVVPTVPPYPRGDDRVGRGTSTAASAMMSCGSLSESRPCRCDRPLPRTAHEDSTPSRSTRGYPHHTTIEEVFALVHPCASAERVLEREGRQIVPHGGSRVERPRAHRRREEPRHPQSHQALTRAGWHSLSAHPPDVRRKKHSSRKGRHEQTTYSDRRIGHQYLVDLVLEMDRSERSPPLQRSTRAAHSARAGIRE
jgi:hypothetical protein